MSYDITSFLLNNNFILVYGIALIISLIRYNKYFESVLKYFPIIIAYTFFNEILGGYIRNNESIQIVFMEEQALNNNLIFNIFDIVFFLYFYFIFYKSIESPDKKKWIKTGAILFIVTCVLNLFFQNFVLYPQVYAIIVGSLNLLLCILLSFTQLSQQKSGLPKSKNLLFWISIGLLIFYFAYPIIMTIAIYFPEIHRELNVRQIHHFLICLMYTCFIIGFIKPRKFCKSGSISSVLICFNKLPL